MWLGMSSNAVQNFYELQRAYRNTSCQCTSLGILFYINWVGPGVLRLLMEYLWCVRIT